MNTKITKKVDDFFTKYKMHTFAKDDIFIRADEDPTGIYYLQTGIVRQYYISKDGDEITLNIFKEHSFFPMSWALSDIHNNYYYAAIVDCISYKAPKEDVLAFMNNEPDVLLDLLKRVYRGIEGLWTHIEYLSVGTALSRLIATLIILGKRFGKKDKDGITILFKISEKELGEYSGMYRETVSREFHKLREKNLITYNKGIISIPNIELLEKILPL